MKDDKNKSIIKEALTDYNEIREAAEANAKLKLAEEFPEKFNNLLKEEMKKNKKPVKESYRKLDENKESDIDETESNKEPVMDKKVEETAKVEPQVVEPAKVDEDVKIIDTVGDSDPYKEKAKTNMDETIKPFEQNVKKPLQTEEFDITELDIDSVGAAIDNAEGNDEVLTMEEIEKEIINMENLDEKLEGIEPSSPSYLKTDDGIAFNKLVEMRNQLDEVIKNFTSSNPQPETKPALGDEMISEEPELTDADIEAVIGTPQDAPVDEAHGVSYTTRRQVSGRNLPNAEHLSSMELDQAPAYLQESKKKIGGLIKENKSLTKKLNEAKKYKESVSALLEQYKNALDKYRGQLKEMSVFNTNLAHVNNLLVNEELALTQEDRIKIINEFKHIGSITESQNKYKAIISEMKDSKKTLTESFEDKVTTSVQSSSKNKLDEVVENTAYADNTHIAKMKKLMEYVDRRDKKIIK